MADCTVTAFLPSLLILRTHKYHVPSILLQVSDGAAASLLMTRREAQRRGLPILGIWRGFSAVGVPPEIMGNAPPCVQVIHSPCGLLLCEVAPGLIDKAGSADTPMRTMCSTFASASWGKYALS
jgi:hypothetical protein